MRLLLFPFYLIYKIITMIFEAIYMVFNYIFKIFSRICYYLFRCVRFILWPLIILVKFIFSPIKYIKTYIKEENEKSERAKAKRKAEAEKKALEAKEKSLLLKRNKEILEENKKRLNEIKKNGPEPKQSTEKYTPEQTKKPGFATFLDDVLVSIGLGPKKPGETKKTKKQKQFDDINRQTLLLDLEGADAEKSEEKVLYKYVARDENGRLDKGYFPAYSKVEAHSFLLSEGKEVYSIKTSAFVRMFNDGSNNKKKKMKTSALIFFTAQLSTYIKAGIPLVESLKIISNQYKKGPELQTFRTMIYDLSMGDNFSDAMLKQGETFPRLLMNMVKAAELTGELPEALDDMNDYYTETNKTKKQMVTALIYPAIVLVFSFLAIVFIMVYVVPKFVGLYDSLGDAELPWITTFILAVSGFLQVYYVWLILGILLFIFMYYYLYKNVKTFRYFQQWLFMHLPVMGNVVIYNEVTMFTKTFASLLSHNVFITDSMEILNKLTENEIYRGLILETIANLAKGDPISSAFFDHWAFPVPAYEMIKTGERTGQLPEMMQKVSAYYQESHKNAVTRIKTFIEPIMIVFLAFVVGGIVLAIMMPMFGFYQEIGV